MPGYRQFVDFLRSTWREPAYADSPSARQGYLGRIPYLLLLRWLVVGAIALRFILHRHDFVPNEWPLILSLVGLAVLVAFIDTWLTLRPSIQRPAWTAVALIVIDIVLISVFYRLTRNPDSDFFLFYYLPMFEATEYLGRKAILVTFVAIVTSFGLVLWSLSTLPANSGEAIWLRVFFPRTVFFMCIVLVSSFLFRSERNQRERAWYRENELQTLLNFTIELEQCLVIDQVLRLTVQTALGSPGTQGAHISLVDYESGAIRISACTDTQYLLPSFLYSASHDPAHSESGSTLQSDIVAEAVVREKNPCTWNDVRSHRSLGSVFSPTVRSAIAVPISAHDTISGVLCVGGSKAHQFDEHSATFLKTLASSTAIALERARLQNAFAEIGRASTQIMQLDGELDLILTTLTDSLGLEFGIISLVDEYRGIIESVRGKNVPPAWISQSRRDLASSDILADIVRSGRTELLEGWDDRFDLETFERFDHVALARVFVPLIDGDTVVGVIETGCKRERRGKLLTSDAVHVIDRLGREKGASIANARSHKLMELIATHAIEIIGADTASVHVYLDDQLLLEASAGKKIKRFLREFAPSCQALAHKAIDRQEPVVIDEPKGVADQYEPLYREGVRALAAFPLRVADDAEGILFVHFWREHKFSRAELDFEKVFARQMEIAIQNTILVRGVSKAAQTAWALSWFQGLVQSLALASRFNPEDVLQDVGKTVLYLLGADVVTLYQFDQDMGRFEFPPVMCGSLRDREAMLTPIDSNTAVWHIVREQGSRFVIDSSSDPLLTDTGPTVTARPRFVQREGIRSTAAVPLVIGDSDQIVGVMFVNYRTPHEFSREETRTIESSGLICCHSYHDSKIVQSC